jgi:hypothetical protein
MFETGTIDLLQENVIFPITYSVAIFVFIFSFMRFRKIMRLPASLLMAITVPFGFASLFELVWSSAYLITGGWKFLGLWYLALCIWFVFGLTSIRYWRVSRSFWLVIGLFVVAWIAWVLLGYPQITGYHTNGSITLFNIALIMNILAKILSGMVFFTLIYDGTKRKKTQRSNSLQSEIYSKD